MKKICYCLLAGIAVNACGIDWNGCRSAKALEKEKRYDEAIAVYEKLSDKTDNEKDDQQYMQWAIGTALLKKDQATAKRLAERIKNTDRRKCVMMQFQKPAEIVEACGGIDFMTWPEDIRVEAYEKRGSAFFRLRRYDDALKDYDKALTIPGGKIMNLGWAARNSGLIYEMRKNTAKAEEYYRKALECTSAGFAWRNESLINLSKLLIAQKRTAEACKIFEPVGRLEKMRGYWAIRLNEAYADALIAADRKVEALKTLDLLLRLVPEKEKPKVKKRIDALSDELL